MATNLILLISPSGNLKLFTNSQTSVGHLFELLVTIMLITALVCFVVGELTRNFSQVDKIWSLMPAVYCWITLSAFPSSPRIWLMAMLVTIWGLRLSYNFYRKGGYNIIPWKGEEDYRWNLLRQNPKLNKPLRTSLFNLLFISLYQNILILLFSTPVILAAQYAEAGMSAIDYMAALFMFIFILIETIADNQLFNFHQQKQNKIPRNGKYSASLSKGFMAEGLWRYVRHPNFAAEQGIWISFYFLGVAASGQWINWTLAGPFLLVLLFAGSSGFTESISSGKYPEYLDYKQKVPKFIPFLFKRNVN